MTNSPKPVLMDVLRQVYVTKECAARLANTTPEVLDKKVYSPEETARSGILEWRVELRQSDDGTCVLLADILVHDNGEEESVIVVLEVDGQEYHPIYDQPHPIGDEL